MATDYLSLRGITKSYAGHAVVSDVSLAIRKGEILTILGPSGCGKTTTLKIIAGFSSPMRARSWSRASRVDHLSSHERGAAMVFQNYALFPHLTVTQNVAFGLRMRRLPKAEIAAAGRRHAGARAACAVSRSLSEGAVRRPAAARRAGARADHHAEGAAARRAVLAASTPSCASSCARNSSRSTAISSITSVFVTHDLEEAFALSDKVAVMNAGVVEQFGAPAKIFASPRSRFVADFVGHKNLLEGDDRRERHRGRVHAAGRPSMQVPPTRARTRDGRRSRCIGCTSRARRSRRRPIATRRPSRMSPISAPSSRSPCASAGTDARDAPALVARDRNACATGDRRPCGMGRRRRRSSSRPHEVSVPRWRNSTPYLALPAAARVPGGLLPVSGRPHDAARRHAAKKPAANSRRSQRFYELFKRPVLPEPHDPHAARSHRHDVAEPDHGVIRSRS